MVAITKPTDINKIWSSGGDIIAPSDTKIASGWSAEIPPRQYFNYIDNKQDQAIAHINQFGICVWDSGTEYQANKSYVQGQTDGAIYRCVQTHTNQKPETDAADTYWALAFATAGKFYDKTETDAKYLAKASDLSDVTNTATARTNLSVYAKSETYTKTEVDTKTTVASTAQAQAQTSNTTLLTPLRLDDAFKGVNQSLGTSGFQELPGGVIIQWGTIAAGSLTANVTLPKTFPNAFFVVTISDTAVGEANACAASVVNTSTFSYRLETTLQTANWIAIGH
jgi:hypothetical protein